MAPAGVAAAVVLGLALVRLWGCCFHDSAACLVGRAAAAAGRVISVFASSAANQGAADGQRILGCQGDTRLIDFRPEFFFSGPRVPSRPTGVTGRWEGLDDRSRCSNLGLPLPWRCAVRAAAEAAGESPRRAKLRWRLHSGTHRLSAPVAPTQQLPPHPATATGS